MLFSRSSPSKTPQQFFFNSINIFDFFYHTLLSFFNIFFRFNVKFIFLQASKLYDEMESQQKGSSKDAAVDAQKQYETAADKAFKIGQAHESAKIKQVEACGDGTFPEIIV